MPADPSPDPRASLPSSAQLARSTVLALVVATVLLVTCILPAEYGVDPTGIGRMIGLTQMGETKRALAEEAAAAAEASEAAEAAAAEVEAGSESSPAPADTSNDDHGTT
jgi:hypothetical protein